MASHYFFKLLYVTRVEIRNFIEPIMCTKIYIVNKKMYPKGFIKYSVIPIIDTIYYDHLFTNGESLLILLSILLLSNAFYLCDSIYCVIKKKILLKKT